MHIQNHETHVSDNNVARTTVVSSDSVEQRIRNTKVVKNKQMLMNRLNWITYLKNLVQEHYLETNSDFSKKIIENFDREISNFIQVCPKEMINKLENPISLKSIIKEVS